jgi:hypothetical protein
VRGGLLFPAPPNLVSETGGLRMKRRLERLEALVSEGGRPAEDTEAHERIRAMLDRVALLRFRQGVAASELVPESEEDVQVLSIFEALGERVERGEGAA